MYETRESSCQGWCHKDDSGCLQDFKEAARLSAEAKALAAAAKTADAEASGLRGQAAEAEAAATNAQQQAGDAEAELSAAERTAAAARLQLLEVGCCQPARHCVLCRCNPMECAHSEVMCSKRRAAMD